MSDIESRQKLTLDTSDTHALLGLYDWSIANSEINDARAWFAVIVKDDPSAVSPANDKTPKHRSRLTSPQWQPLLSLIKLELALNNFQHVEALFGRALKGPSGGITTAADIHVWSEQ